MDIRVARPAETLLKVEGQVAHHVEVSTHGDVDVGSLHLYDDQLPVGQGGAMDLCGRGSRQRFLVKRGIELLQRRSKLAHDDLFGDLKGKRRHIALQLGHLLAPVVGKLLGATGHDLAELDVGRAQFLEHVPHSFRCRFADQRLFKPVDDVLEKAADRSERRVVEGDVLEIHRDDVERLGNAQVFGKVVATAKGELVECLPVAAAGL